MGDRHGPNRLEKYRRVHDAHMERHRQSGFVSADDLAFTPFGRRLIQLSGTIRCAAGILIDVRKYLEILDGSGGAARVKTVAYSYNVRIPGRGNVLRYDGPHLHRPIHHVHRYDVLTGDSIGTIDAVAEDDRPTLGDVIEEVEAWYKQHFGELSSGPPES